MENQNESYTNKYQKHVACSCDDKLVCVYDKFSKSFESHLGEDTVYKPFSSMIEESKYWGDVIRKNFNKELAMTKLDNEGFKNSTKCWICDNNYIDKDIKVRDHCRITGNHRGSAHRDCHIIVKLNHKIPVIFHNLKKYDSYLIM